MLETQIKKFELHYYFGDDLHQMDAAVRNRCESELLKILGELSHILHTPFSIDTVAYSEGGLKELYTFAKNQKFLAGLIAAIVSGVLINVISAEISKDRELINLQKQELRLKIELKKQQLYEKKKQINENQNADAVISIQNDLVFILNNDYRVIKAKSEFYKNLQSYQRVTKFSGQQMDARNNPVAEATVVEREQFHKFILTTDELPKEYDDNAAIELISPVLKKGKYKWRGIYNSESIDFYMKDSVFKSSVFNQQVAFKNGVSLQCVLEISKKMNEIGDIYVSSYSVVTVVTYDNAGEKIHTNQGKQYFREKSELENQLNLFEK